MNLPQETPVTEALIQQASARLAEAVRFATVSHSDPAQIDTERFTAFQDWVAATYPRVAQLTPRRTDPWSLRFFWKGADPNAAPLILLAHYDVVPPGDHLAWVHPAFSGALVDEHVWGRGTLDVKINLVAILEVVEQALAQGFVPAHDVWLCFGGDEEVGGTRGAGVLGRSLVEAGVRDAWLVDEGGVIARDSLSFVSQPLALVGVAEKGFVNVRITVAGRAGHASMPPRRTAVGDLARILTKIEAHPFSPRLTKTLEGFLRGTARHAPALLRPILGAPRLWWPLLKRIFGANPKTAAMIQTTQAITMLAASDKENVLPAQVSAVINVRILPGESVESVLGHYRHLVGRSGTVEVADHRHVNEPLPESEASGPAWDAVLEAVRVAEPTAVPLPYLVTAGTDTRHYTEVAHSLFRTMAIVLGPEEIDLIHSPNERISVANIGRTLRFYASLIRSRVPRDAGLGASDDGQRPSRGSGR